jgi:hypothetical protein
MRKISADRNVFINPILVTLPGTPFNKKPGFQDRGLPARINADSPIVCSGWSESPLDARLRKEKSVYVKKNRF